MPDRAIIPLLPAVALGFICGIIASTLQMSTGAAFALGIAGSVAVALAGGGSVLGVRRADTGEKAIVGVLRAAVAIAVFVAIYLFILSFLGAGKPLLGLLCLIFAGVFGLILTRLDVRERRPLKTASD